MFLLQQFEKDQQNSSKYMMKDELYFYKGIIYIGAECRYIS